METLDRASVGSGKPEDSAVRGKNEMKRDGGALCAGAGGRAQRGNLQVVTIVLTVLRSSFLSPRNDVFPAIGFSREQCLVIVDGGWPRRKHTGLSTHSSLRLSLSLSSAHLAGAARTKATGSDQLKVIPRVESAASQSMKFFLSRRSARSSSESPLPFFLLLFLLRSRVFLPGHVPRVQIPRLIIF